jgi:hypothetical protein
LRDDLTHRDQLGLTAELVPFVRDRGPAEPDFPVAIDLSPGEELWPATATKPLGYAVLLIRVEGFLPAAGAEIGVISAELVAILAERWAFAEHRPDSLIRIADAEFIAVSAYHDSPQRVMDVVDDFRSAASRTVAYQGHRLRAALSIRILFHG